MVNMLKTIYDKVFLFLMNLTLFTYITQIILSKVTKTFIQATIDAKTLKKYGIKMQSEYDLVINKVSPID